MLFRYILVLLFVRSVFTFGASIDDVAGINKLPKETLTLMIKTHYELYENLLLENLSSAVRETAAELQIEHTNSKEVVALLLAYYAVIMHSLPGVVTTVANNAIYSLENRRLSSSSIVFHFSSKSEFAKASEAIFHAVSNTQCSYALHNDCQASASAVYNVALMVNDALKTMGYDPQFTIEIAEASVKLSTLLVLLNISKADFLRCYFVKTYEKSLVSLDSDRGFDITTEEILDIIAKIARQKEDLINNNYLKSLKNIFINQYIRLKSAYSALT